MSRHSPFVITLSVEDRQRLESLVRRRAAEQRMVVRARIVLGAADGEETASIAGPAGWRAAGTFARLSGSERSALAVSSGAAGRDPTPCSPAGQLARECGNC